MVVDARSDRLTVHPDSGRPGSGMAWAITNGASETGWLVNSHHIVEYSYSTRDGETAWRWDLDRPCGI